MKEYKPGRVAMVVVDPSPGTRRKSVCVRMSYNVIYIIIRYNSCVKVRQRNTMPILNAC